MHTGNHNGIGSFGRHRHEVSAKAHHSYSQPAFVRRRPRTTEPPSSTALA
ncbi:MAG: hypothetical protein K0S16_2356, partial [Moraxellaceae bacterium]|nr:hypothetical protein [Moraxellaceae bacterium]